jgi:hypothetical protein
MARLRERWLDVLTTSVTIALLVFVHRVLVDYTSGPTGHGAFAQNQIASAARMERSRPP